MSGSKHDKSEGEGPFTSDLEDDPGIGQSAGLFATGEDPDLIKGDNTAEGDTDNDATLGGGAGEHRIGRTNN
ncbi:MAG TPA: hypothetical protein VF637_12195 [Sphingomicrobium sp.]|jgi:hypothetical protein